MQSHHLNFSDESTVIGTKKDNYNKEIIMAQQPANVQQLKQQVTDLQDEVQRLRRDRNRFRPSKLFTFQKNFLGLTLRNDCPLCSRLGKGSL